MTAPPQWLAGRRSTGLAALAVLALVLLAGAGVWQHGRTSREPVTPAPGAVAVPELSPPATRPATRPAAAPAARGTAGAGDVAAVSARPPGDVTWQLWNTVALPFSRSAGPSIVDGEVARGFARTPAGALLAALHCGARQVAATDDGWRDVATSMLAPGPGRDAWTAYRARVRVPAAIAPGTYLQFAGYRFLSYRADDALVQVVNRGRDGTFVVTPLHLVWLDGDWRLDLAPDGGPAGARQVVGSLAGFVAWGGV